MSNPKPIYRIVMVAPCPYPAPLGSQAFIRATALALRERGHNPLLAVYALGAPGEADGLPLLRAPRTPGVSRIGSGPSIYRPFADAALVWKLTWHLRREPCDILHAHNYEGLAAALAARFLARRSAIPIIYQAHNAFADELPWYFPRWKKAAARVGEWIDGAAPRRADVVAALHQRLAAWLAGAGCPKECIAILPPPCDADQFTETPPEDALPPILYTGNLDPYQNLGLLKKAMEHVRQVEPDARVIIATASPENVPWAEMHDCHDLAELRTVLSWDAVVVCPRVSWSGYPIKLLNAMAAGRPTVACASSAHPITDGFDGLAIPDDDAEAFAAAILRLLHDPALRARIGRNARTAITSIHSHAAHAAALERLYLRAIQDRTGEPPGPGAPEPEPA